MTTRKLGLGILAATLILVAGAAVAASPAVTWTGTIKGANTIQPFGISVTMNAGGATGQIRVAAPPDCSLALTQSAPGSSTYSLYSVNGGLYCDRLQGGRATLREDGGLDLIDSRGTPYQARKS
jgi:hypothetical protein